MGGVYAWLGGVGKDSMGGVEKVTSVTSVLILLVEDRMVYLTTFPHYLFFDQIDLFGLILLVFVNNFVICKQLLYASCYFQEIHPD